MVEGGMKCVKHLLFAFNLLFVLAGIGLIASGAYVKIKFDEYYDFFGNDYMGPGILLIVVGVFIFLLAFFGCCGALKENYCLTMTYAVLLSIIFVLELGGGITGFVMRDDIEKDVKKVLLKKMDDYNSNSTDGITKTWDKLQEEFSCCGVNNYTDWSTEAELAKPPLSCCKEGGKHCTFASPKDLYPKGCTKAFEDWLKGKIAIVGGVGIGLAFIQIVGILFACCLARAIRKEYEVV